MFEAAEIAHRISKARYRREEPALRQALLEAQYRLLEKPEFPLLILIGGLAGASWLMLMQIGRASCRERV